MNQMNQYNEAFIVEAEELLVEIEDAILSIEDNPDDKDAIDRLFRAMHTIKGSSGMFGFNDITQFTHHVETALDLVREGIVSISKALIDIVLQSKDQIKSMLEAAKTGDSINHEISDRIIAELNILLPQMDGAEALLGAEDRIEDNATQNSVEKVVRIRFKPHPSLYVMGSKPEYIIEDIKLMADRFSIILHQSELPELKGFDPETCYLFWDIIITTRKEVNEIKDIFIFIEDDCEYSVDVLDEAFYSEEELPVQNLGEILVEREDISVDELSSLLNKQKRIGELLVETKKVDESVVESALEEQAVVRAFKEDKKKIVQTSSIRVGADKLDSLVDLVGELVTAQARLTRKALDMNDPELVSISEQIEGLTSGLRDNTMSVRMLQIGTTFAGFKRLVRDLSKELNKEIVLETSGEETELDKTVIEHLKDPLVHIIRNSIDHGVETPGEREAKGKEKAGVIKLSAEHSGAHVLIKIADDGKGIDPDAILDKAIRKGLVSQDAMLSQRDIFNLVFQPGFSTAASVSDISGRGVGMDVVKKNIESLRGSVELTSEVDKGTSITLKLPLTLAIIDGLMVRIGHDNYIIPLTFVDECVELNKEEADRVKGRNILNIRDEAVPYIRLREEFQNGINLSEIPEEIVITEVDNQRIGFVVDTVVGSHQTVIKSLGPVYKHTRDIAGATILGDGNVALILDVNRLVQKHSQVGVIQ